MFSHINAEPSQDTDNSSRADGNSLTIIHFLDRDTVHSYNNSRYKVYHAKRSKNCYKYEGSYAKKLFSFKIFFQLLRVVFKFTTINTFF